jgi:hypothetical protein
MQLDSISRRRLALVLVFAAAALIFAIPFIPSHTNSFETIQPLDAYQPIRAVFPESNQKLPDPVQWLRENSNNRYIISENAFSPLLTIGKSLRPRAAIISLVRNSELEGMMQSIRQLEARWNGKYQVIQGCSNRVKLLRLIFNSIRGYFLTMNHSQTNSSWGRRIQLLQNVTMLWSRKSTGHSQTGLMRVGSGTVLSI